MMRRGVASEGHVRGRGRQQRGHGTEPTRAARGDMSAAGGERSFGTDAGRPTAAPAGTVTASETRILAVNCQSFGHFGRSVTPFERLNGDR